MIENLSLVSFFAPVLAGVVTAFLPCTYPMLVGYIALMLGDTEHGNTRRALKTTAWFAGGFAFAYMIIGSIAGLFGQFSQTTLLFNSSKPILLTIGAVFFIVIGLIMLQAIPLPDKLKRIRSIPLPKGLSVHSWWGSFVIGVIFAVGWSPCIGPVLGGILILAGSSGSIVSGALLLLAFAVGLALPLMVIAVLYSQAVGSVRRLEKYIPIMRVIGGILFIILGISFIIGDFSFLNVAGPPAFLEQYI